MSDDLSKYRSAEDLPLTLNAEDIAAVLRISRANAYRIMRRADFPVMQIGSRLLVTKSKFLEWMDSQERPV